MFASSSGVTSSGLFETHSSRACSQPSASGGQTGQESAPPDQAGQSWDNRLFSAEKRRLNRRELCDRRPPKPLRRMRYSEVPREGLEPSRPCGHRILSPARLPIPPPRHINVVVSDEFCMPSCCAKNAPMSKSLLLALRSMGRIIAGVSLETEAELLRYVAARWH